MLPPLEINEKARANGHSVQGREEGAPIFNAPGAMTSWIFPIVGQFADNVPAWSIYPFVRDRFLRTFYKTEPHFASATYSMTAFAKALDLQIDGLPRAKKYAQSVLNDCENGRGYRQLIERSAVDLFTTDNGFFWELVGAGRPDRPLKGALLPPYVLHLDSLNCWRTLDPEYPVIYVNPLTNTYHRMHYTRVVSRSSMEQPDELARGIGFSPASRALRYAQLMRDQLIYRHEKISGKFTRAIGLLKNLNSFEFAQAVEDANESAKSKGFAVYKGIPFLGKASQEIDAKIVDLASVYDGFDIQKELTLYMFLVALAYGVDAREFWPATASGATKADASIQDMKTQGKGKGDVIETFASVWRDVFPDTVEAVYDYTDDEQDLRRSQIISTHATTYSGLQKSGTIDAEEARAHLVKAGVLDAALLKATTPEQANAQAVTDATPEEDEAVETPSSGGAPKIDQPTEESDPVVDTEKGLKELSATREDFFLAIGNVLDAALSKDINRAQFERQLYRLLRRYGDLAYRDGLMDGGVELDSADPLEREDMAIFNRLLDAQSGYISDLASALYNDDVSDDAAASKPDMWWNKSVIPFYQAGLASADANGLYEWVLGRTEKHCLTCSTMAGQRHRMREYVERDLLPQGSTLECKGFHCDCRLEKTRGRTRGRWV